MSVPGISPTSYRIPLLAAVACVCAALLPTAPLSAQKVARPDARAVRAATALVERRASPEAVAREMARRYRQSPAQTAAILRSLRVSAAAAGGAVMGVYRTGGEKAVSALASGGFEAREVVAGMTRAGVGSDEIVRGIRASGVPVREAVVALRASRVPMEEAVSGLYRADVPGSEAARVVKAAYGDGRDGEVMRVMRRVGYAVQAPGITRYWIADFSHPASNAKIHDVGIVDPARVPGAGHPMDGRVTIEGQGLGLEGTRVSIVHDGRETEGEIVAQRDDELEVVFGDFGSGELRVETPGGSASTPVLALSHVKLSASQLFGDEPSWTFTGGRAEIGWTFVGGGTSTSDFSPSGGLDVTVSGGDSNPVITIEEMANEDACVRVTFAPMTVLNGSLTPRVFYWTCGSFEIEKAECPTLTQDCILSNLSDVLSSLMECGDLSNWTEREGDGPPIPIQGQAAISVGFAAKVNVEPNGGVGTSPAAPSYGGDVWNAIPYPPAHGPFTVAEQWWDATVVPALLEPNDAFAEAVRARITQWQQLPGLAGPGMELHDARAQPDGTLLLVFRH